MNQSILISIQVRKPITAFKQGTDEKCHTPNVLQVRKKQKTNNLRSLSLYMYAFQGQVKNLEPTGSIQTSKRCCLEFCEV